MCSELEGVVRSVLDRSEREEVRLHQPRCQTLPLSVYEGTWTHSSPLIAMHLLDRSCMIVGIFFEIACYVSQNFVAKNGHFLEKVFLSKEVSGRKVELDEVILPSLELESSMSQKAVLVMSTPTGEEANDDDHQTSDQVTTEPRRSTGVRSILEWYGNHVT